MKLAKRGNVDISKAVFGVIMAVILVVVLISMAPTLWTQLDTALNSSTDVPFLGSMGGIIGLVFGTIFVVGGIYYLFLALKNR